jgi:hypothetical protein
MTEIQCQFNWNERTRTFLLLLKFKITKFENFRQRTLSVDDAMPDLSFHCVHLLTKNNELIAATDLRENDPRIRENPRYAFYVPTKIAVNMAHPTWAPRWLEYGKIGEVMRFVDFLNSWSLPTKREFRTIVGEDWRLIDDVLNAPWFDWKIRDNDSPTNNSLPTSRRAEPVPREQSTV